MIQSEKHLSGQMNTVKGPRAQPPPVRKQKWVSRHSPEEVWAVRAEEDLFKKRLWFYCHPTFEKIIDKYIDIDITLSS